MFTKRLLHKALGLFVASALLSLAMPGVAVARSQGGGKADLTISMTDSPDPARTGSTVTYSITVTNLGPSEATSVRLVDSYPAGAGVVSATTDRGSCEIAAQVTCILGTIASGQTVGALIELYPGNTGTMTNTAEVLGAQSDPARSNNSVSVTTEVYECGWWCPKVTMTDTPDPATAGEAIVYIIEGEARGPSAIHNGTRLTMTLPDGTEFLGAPECTYKDRTVSCNTGTKPSAKIAIRPLVPGQVTATVNLFIRGHSSPGATATTVTTVGPPRAPNSNTPAPLFDEAEWQKEQAEKTVAEAPGQVETIVKGWMDRVNYLICRFTCHFPGP